MADLLSLNALKCQTAAAIALHDGKTLLIKHKKLGVWMPPGGHLEGDELPHQTAEREFLEETGVPVRAIDPFMETWDSQSQYFPSPILTNLHWVVRENYEARLKSEDPTKRQRTELWPLGCEQHSCFIFLVEPTGATEPNPPPEESQEVRWFTPSEVCALDESEIYPDNLEEILHVFDLAQMK